MNGSNRAIFRQRMRKDESLPNATEKRTRYYKRTMRMVAEALEFGSCKRRK